MNHALQAPQNSAKVDREKQPSGFVGSRGTDLVRFSVCMALVLIAFIAPISLGQQQQSHTPKEMNKPKGRLSAYTFFVQKCRDEHRKAYPNENANFSEFSKKCAEKWKVRIIVTMNKSRTIVCHPYISIRNVRLKS